MTALENEKFSYFYQIESLKDDIQELEESCIQLQRDYRDKSKIHELLTRDFAELKRDYACLEQCIKQRDQLIEERGLVLVENMGINGDIHLSCSPYGSNGMNILGSCIPNGIESEGCQKKSHRGILLSQNVLEMLEAIDGVGLEEKLCNLLKERKELMNALKAAKVELEEEREKTERLEAMGCGEEGRLAEAQRENNKLMHEYRFKVKKAEQEIYNLQNNVTRLETQLARYRTQAEEAEKLEEELKAEKRKILREFREAQARIEELETSNAHLQKRIDKLKNNRMAVINS